MVIFPCICFLPLSFSSFTSFSSFCFLPLSLFFSLKNCKTETYILIPYQHSLCWLFIFKLIDNVNGDYRNDKLILMHIANILRWLQKKPSLSLFFWTALSDGFQLEGSRNDRYNLIKLSAFFFASSFFLFF